LARRGKKRSNKTSDWFSFGKKKKTGRRKSKAGSSYAAIGYKIFLGIVALGCVAAAVIAGFNYLDKHVKTISPVLKEYGQIDLVDKPYWFNSQLVRQVESAAGAKSFLLDENTAAFVADGLLSTPWLYDTKVITTNNAVKIVTKYRKPIALIKYRSKKYYIPDDLIVLDYIPLAKLPILEIKNYKGTPSVGKKLDSDSIASAVEIIKVIDKMDSISGLEKPLLFEIANIDIANLGGVRNTKSPHIIINANDGTQIYWGAAIGESNRYLEAAEKEKLAMLYAFYAEHGTIQGLVKYIELRYPRSEIPRPK